MMAEHNRDDETGHLFVKGACVDCGLKLKDPNIGISLIPGHAANQNFDFDPSHYRTNPSE